jgi:hypothetical protein
MAGIRTGFADVGDEEAKGATGKGKIQLLADQRIVSTRDAQALLGVWDLANATTHEGVPLGPEDLGAAMDAVEHLLKSVYGDAQDHLINKGKR